MIIAIIPITIIIIIVIIIIIIIIINRQCFFDKSQPSRLDRLGRAP
jgi:septation ring formation regulator EzrA